MRHPQVSPKSPRKSHGIPHESLDNQILRQTHVQSHVQSQVRRTLDCEQPWRMKHDEQHKKKDRKLKISK
jgi:hypothetical protein